MNWIPYAQQTLEEDDSRAVLEVLNSTWITRGPKVQEFEKKILQFCNASYAVAFSNGSVALEAACYAGEISPQDTVVSSPNTFVGTVAGALKRTQKLELLDIELETRSPNFNLQKFRPLEQGRYCLFPVHFSGIAQVIERPYKNALIIEDACQAFGAKYPSGEKVGCCLRSDMTVFSFHPAKTLCMAEGGVVTTNNPKYYERLKLFRNNGIVQERDFDPGYYEVHDLTSNYHITELQAALGLNQLYKVDQFLQARRSLVKHYQSRLKEIEGLDLLQSSYDCSSSHNLFCIHLDYENLGCNRIEVMKKLAEKGVQTQVHFIPLYRHPYFKNNYSFDLKKFPNTELNYKRTLSLPLYAHLKHEQVDYICDRLIKVLEHPKVSI